MYKIYLFDIVDEWMLKEVRDHLEKAEEQGEEEIKVYINSPGGSVYSGLAIYNLLKERNVTTEITGIAASMASYIACAGKNVTIQENSVIMIHKPWTMTAGNSDDMEKIQENLEMLEDIISSGYAKQSGIDQDDILDMMAEETWLTAPEAKEKGFVDAIIDDDEQNSVKNYREYFNMVNMAHKKGEDMDLKELWAQIKERFGLESDDPEEGLKELEGVAEQLENARGKVPKTEKQEAEGEEQNAESKEQKVEDKTDNKDYKQVLNQVQEIKKKMEEMENQKTQARVDSLIQNAVNEGKILPAQKDVWKNSAEKDFEGTKEKLDAIPRNSVMPQNVTVDGKKRDTDYENMSMAEYCRMFGPAGEKGGNNG